MRELLQNHPLDLLVLIPSLPDTASLKKLSLTSQYADWFHALNLRLQFFTNCAIEDQRAIAAYFKDPITIAPLSEEEAAAFYNCQQSKPVFGKERQYIFPSLILKDGNTILHQTRRINPSAIHNLLQAALKAQYSFLKESLAEPIDILPSL